MGKGQDGHRARRAGNIYEKRPFSRQDFHDISFLLYFDPVLVCPVQ